MAMNEQSFYHSIRAYFIIKPALFGNPAARRLMPEGPRLDDGRKGRGFNINNKPKDFFSEPVAVFKRSLQVFHCKSIFYCKPLREGRVSLNSFSSNYYADIFNKASMISYCFSKSKTII
jgi:hypothetical protein